MMLAFALLAGCPGEAAKDSESASLSDTDTGEPADTAIDPCSKLETCSNGLDDDCDGEADEAECVLAWIGGDAEYADLGNPLTVSLGDAAASAYGAVNAESTLGSVGSLRLDGAGRFAVSWSDTSSEGRGNTGVSAANVGVASYVGYETIEAPTGFIRFVDLGASAPANPEIVAELAFPDTREQRGGFALFGAATLSVATMVGPGSVARVDDVRSDSASLGEPDTDYRSENEDFGRGVGHLADSGTGESCLMIAAFPKDPDGNPLELYFFDASVRGMLTPDVADATLTGPGGAAYELQAAGDVNGDGHTDIAFNSGTTTAVYLGPFAGVMDGADALVTGGRSVFSQGSLDGDEYDDLVALDVDGENVMFVQGPISSGFMTLEDLATETLPLPGTMDRLVVTDLDGDGGPELLLSAHASNGNLWGVPDSAGVMVALAAPEWMMLPAP